MGANCAIVKILHWLRKLVTLLIAACGMTSGSTYANTIDHPFDTIESDSFVIVYYSSKELEDVVDYVFNNSAKRYLSAIIFAKNQFYAAVGRNQYESLEHCEGNKFGYRGESEPYCLPTNRIKDVTSKFPEHRFGEFVSNLSREDINGLVGLERAFVFDPVGTYQKIYTIIVRDEPEVHINYSSDGNPYYKNINSCTMDMVDFSFDYLAYALYQTVWYHRLVESLFGDADNSFVSLRNYIEYSLSLIAFEVVAVKKQNYRRYIFGPRLPDAYLYESAIKGEILSWQAMSVLGMYPSHVDPETELRLKSVFPGGFPYTTGCVYGGYPTVEFTAVPEGGTIYAMTRFKGLLCELEGYHPFSVDCEGLKILKGQKLVAGKYFVSARWPNGNDTCISADFWGFGDDPEEPEIIPIQHDPSSPCELRR